MVSTKQRVLCQGGVGYGTSHQIDIQISPTQFYTAVDCTMYTTYPGVRDGDV